MEVEKKLRELGIKLPKPPRPLGIYVGAKKAGLLVYTSGQTPGVDFKRGKIGKDLTLQEGYEAAKKCAINCISQLKAILGDLDRIENIIKVTGYINSADNFSKQSFVLNGFTDLLVNIFGEKVGCPARAAIAVNVEGWHTIEAEMIVQLKE